ncbi:hypothetical protein [Lysobacter sp. F6437]|uniref:hypothetical protein n=1 Tax=Lysobacter sp. F6437 TaxID=3459296 RepID=UPI00403D9040
MNDDGKIVSLPRKAKPAAEAALTVVHNYGKCQHRHVEVDEKLAEVTCTDCKAKLNPVHVLAMLSREDDRLRDRWAGMRAEIRLLGERTRVKCDHCRKFTRVRINASYAEVRELTDRIKAEESL